MTTARTHCTAQGLEILADTKRSALAELAGLQDEQVVETPCAYTLTYRKAWRLWVLQVTPAQTRRHPRRKLEVRHA